MKDYYKNAMERAMLRAELIREAIVARLESGKIDANALGLHAEVLKDAEDSMRSAQDGYQNELAKESAEKSKEDAE